MAVVYQVGDASVADYVLEGSGLFWCVWVLVKAWSTQRARQVKYGPAQSKRVNRAGLLLGLN
ncbi:hypothetical protein HanHA300_Chr05g0168871 [Helianthus annuus]|nr:hypothetical protein HanHA300_Chr05g0168871 [Helianthus annuus]KAJ0583975.1 hypothetical protein HanHA89_Chr05g0182961 [Helianthus annuus]KAJ0749656.1 hypothetical protein HanLR1_Chr05g0172571 [Helianthus annuus]